MKNVVLPTVCLVAACFTARAGSDKQAVSKDKPDYTIENCIIPFSMQKTESAKSGWFYWFFRESFTDGLNLKMSYVDKTTETHPPHRHDDKEIYYIVEGNAEIFLAGATRVIGSGTAMYCPPDVMHGIKRADDQPLKYLVIKGGSNILAGRDANDDKTRYTLDNCVAKFSDGKADKSKVGWYFWFFPKAFTGGLNLKMTYVDKLAGTHEPHQHAGEEILYLLEGKATVFLNGASKVIESGTGIYYPEYSLHCIKRVNDQPIKYLVINP